ncbi:MAG: MgtC/SapB family protein [Clostridia bacterium]|nr:MgtC/SapB family protein [Clostridia bacterium]
MEQFLLEMEYMKGIAIALALGFAIGFERKLRSKEAGIRTHTIVCVGAALMMVISKYGFEFGRADTARIAAQIVSGVGFLGAGIIMLRGQKMYGLTTAAGVWATAGVGMAAGAGLYYIALFSTVIIILIHLFFHINRGPFRIKKHYQIRISFRNVGDEHIQVKAIFGVSHFNKLTLERKEDYTVFNAYLNTDKEYSSQVLSNIMEQNPYILVLERCDDV